MSPRSLAILLAVPAAEAAPPQEPFTTGLFGKWETTPGETPQSILGPLAYSFINPAGPQGGFSAQRDPKTGDVWWTLLGGQVFHLHANEMQYCFGVGDVLTEQSPFSVDSVTDNATTFCWRKGLRGMPTQAKDCKGCECAKIELRLTDTDKMHFTFWMSPPIVHASSSFIRAGPAPTMKDIQGPDDYKKCDVTTEHYGPNVPGQPDLRNATLSPQREMSDDAKVHEVLAGYAPGCAQGVLRRVMAGNKDVSRMLSAGLGEPRAGAQKCHQLNGLNHMMNGVGAVHKTKVPDVRLQYIEPKGACDPCDVSYSISADVEEDEYIALGFKGQSWEAMFPHPPEIGRHCYFGMCVDHYDNFTTDRIALGYASSAKGSCVRELTNTQYAGKPTDVDYKIMGNTSVERIGKKTVARFTLSQHWPKGASFDGPFRTMWAIGKLMGDGVGCQADFGYHGKTDKGLSPITWLETLGSTPCKFNPAEMSPH